MASGSVPNVAYLMGKWNVRGVVVEQKQWSKKYSDVGWNITMAKSQDPSRVGQIDKIYSL